MVIKTGFLWILLAGVLYGAIHSAFASDIIKKWLTNQFCLDNAEFRFVYALQSFFFTLVYVLLIFFLPDARLYTIPAPWVYLTTLIEVAALIGGVVSLVQKGLLSFLGLSAFTKKGSRVYPLKTDGIYRFLRHPLYMFSLLVIWLLPLMSWNILAFNIGATLYMFIGSLLEERKLIREYGEAYLEYKKRVPAFWPKFSH